MTAWRLGCGAGRIEAVVVTMYRQEVEREMLARNRDQFGFRVIDSPRVPDRKSKPQRAGGAVTATILSFLAACIFFVFHKNPLR